MKKIVKIMLIVIIICTVLAGCKSDSQKAAEAAARHTAELEKRYEGARGETLDFLKATNDYEKARLKLDQYS